MKSKRPFGILGGVDTGIIHHLLTQERKSLVVIDSPVRLNDFLISDVNKDLNPLLSHTSIPVKHYNPQLTKRTRKTNKTPKKKKRR